MNLEASIEWLEKEILIEKNNKAPAKKIQVYEKYLAWMKELLRYRLFRSEFTREIEIEEFKDKAALVKFMREEYEDWRLDEIVP